MSKLGLTHAERRYVARIASTDPRGGQRVAFYTAVLAPLFAFAAFGIVRRDVVALALAFAGLATFLIWRIAQEIASAPLYFSVFSKIEASESAAPPESGRVSSETVGKER